MSSPFPHAFRQCIEADFGRDYVGEQFYEAKSAAGPSAAATNNSAGLLLPPAGQVLWRRTLLSQQISAEKLESAVTHSLYNFHVSAPSWHRPMYGGQAAACIVHRPWTDKLAVITGSCVISALDTQLIHAVNKLT